VRTWRDTLTPRSCSDDTMTRSAHKSGIAGGPLLQAVSDVVGRPISKQGCSFAGKTDTANVRALLTANEVVVDGPEAKADIEHRVFQALPKIMEAGVNEGVFRYEALPGVKALVAALHARSDVVQGLLTGNLEACCPVKLGAAGIDHSIFPFGAFGSDSADRNTLLPVAVSKYEALMGETISPDRVVVIGDTPADVECATTHGARCLAVASGSYSCAQLEGANPTYCLQDLSDVQTVLGLLFDDGQYE
jgi:phosphoglycolate phosphatase